METLETQLRTSTDVRLWLDYSTRVRDDLTVLNHALTVVPETDHE